MYALSPARHDVAVVLNANAKRVTPALRARVEAKVHGADIYYSRSLEEAQTIARRILEGGYSTVLTGGGDGTFIQMVNLLYRMTHRIDTEREMPGEMVTLARARALAGRSAHRYVPGQMPNVGILRLGTGNAVANLVSAGDYVKDIQTVQSLYEQGRTPGVRQIGLMTAERQVFPFAGLGWDGAVLNDYMALKSHFAGSALEPLVKSAAGYLLAAFFRTAPRLMVQPSPHVEITALEESFGLDSRGRRVQRFAPGSLMFRGPVNMVCFGTVPYIGARVKLFPHSVGVMDAFHLRAVQVTAPEAFLNLPRQWFGWYHSPRIHEFHARRVRVAYDRPVPYQMGGDAMGDRQVIEVGMSAHPLQVVDFRKGLEPRGMLPMERASAVARLQ